MKINNSYASLFRHSFSLVVFFYKFTELFRLIVQLNNGEFSFFTRFSVFCAIKNRRLFTYGVNNVLSFLLLLEARDDCNRF